jgi:hypothetical protein
MGTAMQAHSHDFALEELVVIEGQKRSAKPPDTERVSTDKNASFAYTQLYKNSHP